MDKKYWGQQAWEAGKQWEKYGAASSGVANARVVTYGFSKWWNSLHPDDTKGTGATKAYLLKSFREGYTTQKRLGSRNPAAAGIGSKPVLCRVKRVGNKLHITKVGR